MSVVEESAAVAAKQVAEQKEDLSTAGPDDVEPEDAQLEEEDLLEGHFSGNSLSVNLSDEIKAFMKENNIPSDAYDVKVLSRFIRINPSKPITLDELQQQLKANPPPEPVPWLPSFYRLDRNISISGSKAYREGRIYGIDACSGAVVRALDAKPGHHVLDLCCAPGSKLCMLGDEINHLGSVTGVDVVKKRLSACKTLLRKYNKLNTRLFLTDGSTFSVLAPGSSESSERAELPPLPDEDPQPPLKKARTRRKGREKDVDNLFFCNTFPLRSADSSLYDRVLVDAECSGDASIRHILLFGKSSPVATPQLTQLQRKLILNGFRLLKPGGVMVYSTCSFCTSQNEDVVQYLLDSHSNAKLLPIQFTHGDTTADIPEVPWDKGSLEHTVRFYPKNSSTSGMFIAKITKTVP